MKKYFVLLALVGAVGLHQPVSAADITGLVSLNGTPPAEIPYTPIREDETCSRLNPEMPTTRFFVVGPNHELGDVVVMLKGITGKSTGASAPPVVMDQKHCLFVPQIIALQTGQRLLVRNSDPVLHNVHTVPAAGSGNKEENHPQLAGSADMVITFDKPENFLKFKCDVHKWMFAWVTVVDHPYFAVTGKDGRFTIKNVPPGKYTIMALHRKAAPNGVDKEIEVKDGTDAKVDFTLELN